jgi:hypothetical protein
MAAFFAFVGNFAGRWQRLMNVSALSDARFHEAVKLCIASAAGRLRSDA